MEVQKYLTLAYYEHSHREMPARLLRIHRGPGYTRPGYMGSQATGANLHNV
jgi:hypothetical protein